MASRAPNPSSASPGRPSLFQGSRRQPGLSVMEVKGSHRHSRHNPDRRKLMRHSTSLAVIAGVLGCAVLWNVAQAGDVYKYVDERGNTLYTDRPMPGAVRVSSGVVRPPEVAQRSYAAQQSAANQQLSSSNQHIAQGQDDQRVAGNVQKDVEAS